MISLEEQDLIIAACCYADDWDAGRLTYSRNAIIDAGFEWTPEHERFVFDWDDE